jgi:hypothetical protein
LRINRKGEMEMKTFHSIEELKPHYNDKTNTYEFVENGVKIDVKFTFNLDVDSNIIAGNIDARGIKARDIKAWDINAGDINAGDINASYINAIDIEAWNIIARNINANDISYYAVCFTYYDISCTSITGRRSNYKHFALDGKITIKPKEQPKKVTLELTDEQLEKVKKILEK